MRCGLGFESLGGLGFRIRLVALVGLGACTCLFFEMPSLITYLPNRLGRGVMWSLFGKGSSLPRARSRLLQAVHA